MYKKILWFGLAGVMVFAPLARGAVRIWSITPIEMVVLLLVFLWLCRVNNKKKIVQIKKKDYTDRVRKTAIDIPIWLFVGLAGISCVFSIYKYASVMEMLRLLTVVGVFYLVVNNFGRRMSLRMTSLIIIMGTGMSLLGLGQYFLGLEHSWWKPDKFLAATYVNHNHFAGYLELAIPLAIGMLLGKRTDYREQITDIMSKIVLGVSLLIMLAAFIFSQSRGAWICLSISLVVMNMILVRKKVLKKESLAIFLLIIILGVVYIYAGHDAIAKRLYTVEAINNEGFIEGRIKIWQGSLRMIKDNPLYGTGLGSFVWGFPRYRSQTLQIRAHYAHNDYLHMIAEMGLLALPLMLWMIGGVVTAGLGITGKNRIEINRNKPAARAKLGEIDGVVLGSAAGILSLALHGLVDFNFHITANMLVVACLAGIVMRRAE